VTPPAIPPFEILAELGQSSACAVYRARDPRLGREVVLKLLRIETERARKRLEREAKAMARLVHPSVVPLLELGEHEGRPYLVQPYVAGDSLAERIERGGPLPLREALQIGRELAEALVAVHALELLHRDVEPARGRRSTPCSAESPRATPRACSRPCWPSTAWGSPRRAASWSPLGQAPARGPGRRPRARRRVFPRGRLPRRSRSLSRASPCVVFGWWGRYTPHVPQEERRPSELEALCAENASLREQLAIVTEIGTQLSAERDLDSLLEGILTGARRLTHADAGSLYLLEGHDRDQLRFKLAQNDSVDVPFRETVIDLGSDTIVGYVARTREPLCFDDVYELSDDAAYRFSKGFDEQTGYRTKSMLVVPMIDHRERVIGCLQLINRKPDPGLTLKDPAHAEEVVIPFSESCQAVLESLASQSAVAIDKAKLIKDLEDTFEGLVFASVVAIESRDPTTSGHSERVAQLSVSLAKTVSDVGGGKFADVSFSGSQLKELRYASLLHDFGKVGVQERVLVKAKKLFPTDLEVVRARFACAMKDSELKAWRHLVQQLKDPRADAAALIATAEAQITHDRQLLRDMLDLVLAANEPRLLPEGSDQRLRAIAQHTYLDEEGATQPLLRENEILDLSIPRGSLNAEQRVEIESHVTHTYRFLVRIPWTEELRDLPRIAGAHHEKLDGSGYPHGLSDPEIPPQAKIMSVCDIFDALTAWDRPYKKAVPLDRALSILEAEAKAGKIETELVEMFRERKLYEPVLRKKP